MKATVLLAVIAVAAVQLLTPSTNAQAVIPGYPSSAGLYPSSAGVGSYPGADYQQPSYLPQLYPPSNLHIHGPLGSIVHNILAYARYVVARILYIPINIFLRVVRFFSMLLGVGYDSYSSLAGAYST